MAFRNSASDARTAACDEKVPLDERLSNNLCDSPTINCHHDYPGFKNTTRRHSYTCTSGVADSIQIHINHGFKEKVLCQPFEGAVGTWGDRRGSTEVSFDQTRADQYDLEYGVEDNPPLHMCVVFGLQVLLSISSTISIPMIVSAEICAGHLEQVQSEIMSTFLFMCGVCTILQCSIGVRLPIIQGGCHKFIPAVVALMALETWRCPEMSRQIAERGSARLNFTGSNWSTSLNTSGVSNSTYMDETELWQSRLREIQGGIIVASITQVLIGCTGLLGVLLQFIGPLTIVPTITLVGLSLVDVSLMFCMKHWGIACLTIFLAVLFSLYLRDIKIPVAGLSRKRKCFVYRYPFFKLLPVILAVGIAWTVSFVLTQYGIFSSNPDHPHFFARTDARKNALRNARWLFMPYPTQWGMPTVSAASFMGMLAATLTSIIESVGDYYACARVSGVASPPAHAVNRGIAIEGIGSILSGLVGSGGATTSYSQNVGAIAFTKVASRRVFIVAGFIFILCGIVGKIGAFLTMLPQPVLGGIVVVSFGMVTTIGLSNLHFVNMSSGRNMCILGLSLMLGLMVPRYLSKYPHAINTGYSELDQVLSVLLSTSMFVGGFVGFVMDTTVPGSVEERGILKWRCQYDDTEKGDDRKTKDMTTYNLPYIMPLLRKCTCSRFLPFLPTFSVSGSCVLLCGSKVRDV